MSRTPHKTVVSKTSEADIWLSSYDLTDVGGQREGGQQLSQTKGAFFLLNEKEAWSGLIQVPMMMKRGEVDKQGQSMIAGYRYLGVSNQGLKMLGRNESDVSCLYGTRASFQYIRRVPALYYSKA